MDLEVVKTILGNWHSKEGYKIQYCPPEAKFISGDPKVDARLHQFKVDSGLEIILNTNNTGIKDWRIIDNEKFLMFALKWS